jgi:hypothetical protein
MAMLYELHTGKSWTPTIAGAARQGKSTAGGNSSRLRGFPFLPHRLGEAEKWSKGGEKGQRENSLDGR